MGLKHKASIDLAKTIQNYLGVPTHYKQLRLTQSQQETVRDAYYLWLLIVGEKCICNKYKVDERVYASKIGNLITLVKQVSICDVYGLLKILDYGSQYLLDTTTGDKPMDPYSWKQELKGLSGEENVQAPVCTLLGLTSQIAEEWFHSSCVESFRDLRTIFCFLGRLCLRGVESLKDVALETWHEVEMKTWPKLTSGQASGQTEKEIISEWFPIEDMCYIAEYFSPHHGTGSTFERVSNPFDKALLNTADAKVLTVYKELDFPYTLDNRSLMASPYVREYAHEERGLSAHLVTTVPKSWKTDRTISMERTGMMFAQEGAMQAIFSYLKHGHTAFARHYCVDTEAKNRIAAQAGSEDGFYATLDQSNASDNVPLDLVEQWFGESCLMYLVSLRSDYAKFDTNFKGFKDQDIIKVSKFAPMGSALCFPIECIVFGAIVERCLRKRFGRRHHLKWWVYGDDLVVPVCIVEDVISRMRELGFEPNMRKSYWNTRNERSQNLFRESCGGEYLNGIDVTPARISRKFEGLYSSDLWSDNERKVRSITCLVQLANDLYDHSYAARWAIVDLLLNKRHLPIYCDETGDSGLRSACPSNRHLARSWNNDYQRFECRCYTVVSRRKRATLLERYRATDLDQLSEDLSTLTPLLGQVYLYEYLRLASKRSKEKPAYKYYLSEMGSLSTDLDPRSFEMRAVLAVKPDPAPLDLITMRLMMGIPVI